MEKGKIDKRLLSPNKINLPITVNENGILDEYIQANDKNCLEVFTCSICTCLVWDPVFCPKCDKAFCRACIVKYGKNKKCPFKCDSNTFREITRNEKNYLNKIKIKCTNVGCQKYIPYFDYVNHLEKCQLRKYHCKNQNCNEEGYISDMINHSKTCPYRTVACTKCKQNIKFNDMKTHQQEFCPEIIIKCKLCGTSMKRGIYLKDHKSDNNENVKCLKLQVEKWSKVYNEDINTKNKEIAELRKRIKEIEKNKKKCENENATLKKNIGEIEAFFKSGYSKFFGTEKNNEKSSNKKDQVKEKEIDFINIGHLNTDNSFNSRNQSNNKIIYRCNGSCDKKYVKVAILNKKACSIDKERVKVKYLQHIKNVQSVDNLPNNNNNNNQTYDNSNNPFK